MTTVQITLPDQLAEEAAKAGLLAADRIEAVLREQLRQARVARLRAVRQSLGNDPLPTMTPEEPGGNPRLSRWPARRSG